MTGMVLAESPPLPILGHVAEQFMINAWRVRCRWAGPLFIGAGLFIGCTERSADKESSQSQIQDAGANQVEDAGTELADAGALDSGNETPFDGGMESPDAATPAPDLERFRETESMRNARCNHSATLLMNGHVLVVGGENVLSRVPTNTVEIYQPEYEYWARAPALPAPRSNHAAVLMRDGRVLVAGGGRNGPIGVPNAESVTGSAMIFDPVLGQWTATGDLLEPRSHAQAAVLPSGRVLVVGGGAATHDHGNTCSGVPDCGYLADTLASAEIFDPASGTFSATSPMQEARVMFTLTPLPDGRLLAAAGANDYQVSFKSTEIYDEQTASWSPGPDLVSDDRLFHNAALLPSGRVLIGAGKKSNVAFLKSVNIVDVVNTSADNTASLSKAHTAGQFVALQSGHVLSTGGFVCPPCSPIGVNQIYDEQSGAWVTISPLITARAAHTATLLQDGRVLVAGGYDLNGVTLVTSELSEAP